MHCLAIMYAALPCVAQVNLTACQARCVDKETKIKECEATIAAKLAEIDEANTKIRRDETLRRKLHNTILELKVRFFATKLAVCLHYCGFWMHSRHPSCKISSHKVPEGFLGTPLPYLPTEISPVQEK